LPGDEGAVILSSKGADKRLVRRVPPILPVGANAQGLEGTVILKTVVDDSGNVESVYLMEGNPALADAAIHAVKQWRYRPYVRDGKSLPFQTVVLVDFQRP
jgi:protein TonB